MVCNISFHLNNRLTQYSGNASSRLLDVLRCDYKLTGTKCGCLEGECGACSVIIDGQLRNSCLVAMGSLDGARIITIEGYSKTARFEVISRAFASVSAVQCGYCIPGMVLACECLLAANPNPSDIEIREAISGNLCRCTGYNAIVKAIGFAAKELTPVSPNGTEDSTAGDMKPTAMQQALETLSSRNLTPYCGGTDLMVNKKSTEKDYLFIGNIPELKQITEDDEFIRFGAACTFTGAINHPLTPAVLRDMCKQIAAPAIRNAGTLGGNLANGSAKADAALIFAVTDSLVHIASVNSRRTVAVKDFYLGNGKVDLKPGELIAEILMPKNELSNFCLKKVGARKALAISRVSFAGILDMQDGIIAHLAVAFGAVSDVILRFEHIDKMLIGKTVNEARALRDDYLAAYEQAIVPRRGRVSVEYRKDVCLNLLNDFLSSNGI